MHRSASLRLFCAVAIGLALARPLRAEVTRIDIASRTDVLNGRAFGDAGAYEKLVGKVHFAVDPQHLRNKGIADIDKAPRNARGLVEFSGDLFVLRPKDPAKGNGAALFDVLNRGTKFTLQRFDRAPTQASSPGPGQLDVVSESDFGDGFLLRRGYTLVWIGWQFDVPPNKGMMGMEAPIATDAGRVITGMVSSLFTPSKGGPESVLADVHYLPADGNGAEDTLVVREGYYKTRTIPRSDWQLVVMPRTTRPELKIALKSGFQAGAMYEVTYRAQAPAVQGLGLAVFRDLASAMKYDARAAVTARYAYVYGASQSGRFLNEFLWGGFNADEHDRKAFDGVIADLGGASRGSFNERFATPASLVLWKASRFPYLESPQRDPVTGQTDGLLSRLPPSTWPKVFHTFSASDYWGGGRAAAYSHTTLDGRDATVPDNVRMYFISGSQHLPTEFPPPPSDGQQRGNPNDSRWALRALLVAMDRWVRGGVAAPPSQYPRLADGTLVLQQKVNFPAIPGVQSPTTIPGPYRGDLPGKPTDHLLPFLVPQVDADGNEKSGIRLPDVAVPIATYTGWNFRNPSAGVPEPLALSGASIPFAATKAARDQRKDPRPSVAERYQNRADFEKRIGDAGRKLAQQGYLLNEDVPAIVARALQQWDALTPPSATAARR